MGGRVDLATDQFFGFENRNGFWEVGEASGERGIITPLHKGS
jgi:hypothetical protein